MTVLTDNMTFGTFMAPFHRVGENPTLALEGVLLTMHDGRTRLARDVEREVRQHFPELVFVTRHGCEPWTDLAVKLMLKYPNLSYMTSAFAPKHYPKAIVDYANTRGADKILYAGYFPMGLSLERIMTDMQGVGFKDEVWPKFLRENALRVFKIKSNS